MSTYLGSTLISGVATETKYNANTLLDYKPSDHKLNSMEWLRSNTFSWQSGKVYKAAYAHLTADYSGGTSKTETIGSYTISFVEAADGHRITTDETTVANIYNESGVAWFYVLDTTNQRFKLPRKHSTQIVQSVVNNNGSWYRLYTDGWVEQGGYIANNSTTTTVILPITMADTNYCILGGLLNGTASATYEHMNFNTLTTTSFNFTTYDNYGVKWQVSGMSAVDMSSFRADEEYLYFYVGEYSQSATEQTAGINAELFNGKMDLDGGNATSDAFDNLFSNASSSVKKAIAEILIPDWSSDGQSYSAGSAAPSDGFIWAYENGEDLYVNGIKVGSHYVNAGSGWNTPVCNACCYVKQGDVVTGATFYFKPLNL